MADINTTIAIILNMTGLNKPIKRQIVRLDKNKTVICCVEETYFRFKDKNGLKVKR